MHSRIKIIFELKCGTLVRFKVFCKIKSILAAKDLYSKYAGKETGSQQWPRTEVLCGRKSRSNHRQGCISSSPGGNCPAGKYPDGRKETGLQFPVRFIKYRVLRPLWRYLSQDKWNNRRCKSTVWWCVSRILKKSSGIDCPARAIREEELHTAVVTAINDTWTQKDRILPILQKTSERFLKVIHKKGWQ